MVREDGITDSRTVHTSPSGLKLRTETMKD